MNPDDVVPGSSLDRIAHKMTDASFLLSKLFNSLMEFDIINGSESGRELMTATLCALIRTACKEDKDVINEVLDELKRRIGK